MNLRALAVGLVLALSALFAVLNWAAFTAPTALTLGFADVNAPLGLIMLVLTALVSGLFLVYIVFQQAYFASPGLHGMLPSDGIDCGRAPSPVLGIGRQLLKAV